MQTSLGTTGLGQLHLSPLSGKFFMHVKVCEPCFGRKVNVNSFVSVKGKPPARTSENSMSRLRTVLRNLQVCV